MRVIAGILKSRRLRMPVGVRIRPTADRVKEGMFNCLGADVVGRRVLDLYAGSGALGIESLSRGAAYCLFVERRRQCVQTLRENTHLLKLDKQSRILQSTVQKALKALGSCQEKFDLILADPPYLQGDTKEILHLIVDSDILTPPARVVLEHHRDTSVGDVEGRLTYQMTKRYGDSAVSFFAFGD